MTRTQTARAARIASLNRQISDVNAELRAVNRQIAACDVRIIWHSGGNWLLSAIAIAYAASKVL